MIFNKNYHTHTWRCRHASGTEREYVENAIREGFVELGFSDHTPYWFPEGMDYYSTMRMFPDQLEDYVNTVRSLQKEYAGDISIKLGLEVEYLPNLFGTLMEKVKPYNFDYFILGQHFTKDEYDGRYNGNESADHADLTTYVDQAIAGMETGEFMYLAHPDLPYYTGDRAFYEKEMRRLCIRAKELDMPLEINLQGLWMDRWYPDQGFWKIAGEVGNTACIGSDAHSSDKIACPQAAAKAMEMIRENHLEVAELKFRQ